jgi:hypothetical protein
MAFCAASSLPDHACNVSPTINIIAWTPLTISSLSPGVSACAAHFLAAATAFSDNPNVFVKRRCHFPQCLPQFAGSISEVMRDPISFCLVHRRPRIAPSQELFSLG